MTPVSLGGFRGREIHVARSAGRKRRAAFMCALILGWFLTRPRQERRAVTMETKTRRIRPYQDGDDRHQIALYRLAAVSQYLYDVMGSPGPGSERPEPLPELAMESVREAQALIDRAMSDGQRVRRRPEYPALGGQLDLVESWRGLAQGMAPAPVESEEA